jgi:hypothetical protein
VKKIREPAQAVAVQQCERMSRRGRCVDWDPQIYREGQRLRFTLRDDRGREGSVDVDRFTFDSYAVGDNYP